MVVKRELYGGDRSCLHIEFDIVGSKLRYETGDHLALYPSNDGRIVDNLGKLLDQNLDEVITMEDTDEDCTRKHPFPCPTTYRSALIHYVDICGLPGPHLLRELSEFCGDDSDREKLEVCFKFFLRYAQGPNPHITEPSPVNPNSSVCVQGSHSAIHS